MHPCNTNNNDMSTKLIILKLISLAASNPTQPTISTVPITMNSTVNATNATMTTAPTGTFLTTGMNGPTRVYSPCNDHAVWQGVAVLLQNLFIFIG